MNYLMRPVYNRPEMLSLSLEYEINAREQYNFSSELTTLFLIEHGTPQKTIDLLNNYPYESKYIKREKKYGLTVNILEGFKEAFNLSDDFVIYIEDDVLIHKTYFQYMDVLMSLVGDFSVLSAYNFDDAGDINEIRVRTHYAALAPLINKEFFEQYIKPNTCKEYYANRQSYVNTLDLHYSNYGKKLYKYSNSRAHNEQAGMINRMVDIAYIEEELPVYMPAVNRQQHIGYFGKNRPGGVIPGDDYETRLVNLRNIIKDPKAMYALSATKMYNDYKAMPEKKLANWSGTLYVK